MAEDKDKSSIPSFSELVNTASQLSKLANDKVSQLGKLVSDTASQLSETASHASENSTNSDKPKQVLKDVELRYGDIYENKENILHSNAMDAEQMKAEQETLFSLVQASKEFVLDKNVMDEIKQQIQKRLENGADPLFKDEHGKTAFDYLAKHENTDIQDILNKHVIKTERSKTERSKTEKSKTEKSATETTKDEIAIDGNPMHATISKASIIVPTAHAIPISIPEQNELPLPHKLNPLAKHGRASVTEAITIAREEITEGVKDKSRSALGSTFARTPLAKPSKSVSSRQR